MDFWFLKILPPSYADALLFFKSKELLRCPETGEPIALVVFQPLDGLRVSVKCFASMSQELNSDQAAALEYLNSQRNVFLTGAAGSGKSHLLRFYLKKQSIPILASTGAAAILVGGRTFHSFFGLGIMEGGPEKTFERALQNKKLVRRLKKTDAVVIDEVSMISGTLLRVAEKIARKARGGTTPWGGIRVIMVGDFAQLPPVNPFGTEKEWAFLDEVWIQSEFQTAVLRQPMRTSDPSFFDVLNNIRLGECSQRVIQFLNDKVIKKTQSALPALTRLFPFRERVEKYNLERLEAISHPVHRFETTYRGSERDIESFRKHSPIGDEISLKREALVILRQNDVEGRWVNGTTGIIERIDEEALSIRLLCGPSEGEVVQIERADFTLLNADGDPAVTATNFPVTLAWAMTIHKAQGATLDQLQIDLRGVWEPGQAYVALSRARDPEKLALDGWHPRAIFADPAVAKFHRGMERVGI